MASFKIDENLPVEVAEILRAGGHDALTIPDQHMSGSSDPNVAAVCQHEDRVLITLDLDFADIRAYSPADYCGIIVLRLHRVDKARLLAATQRLLPILGQEPLAGRLWIVEETRIRIRS